MSLLTVLVFFLSDFLETFEEVKANEQVCPQILFSLI